MGSLQRAAFSDDQLASVVARNRPPPYLKEVYDNILNVVDSNPLGTHHSGTVGKKTQNKIAKDPRELNKYLKKVNHYHELLPHLRCSETVPHAAIDRVIDEQIPRGPLLYDLTSAYQSHYTPDSTLSGRGPLTKVVDHFFSLFEGFLTPPSDAGPDGLKKAPIHKKKDRPTAGAVKLWVDETNARKAGAAVIYPFDRQGAPPDARRQLGDIRGWDLNKIPDSNFDNEDGADDDLIDFDGAKRNRIKNFGGAARFWYLDRPQEGLRYQDYWRPPHDEKTRFFPVPCHCGAGEHFSCKKNLRDLLDKILEAGRGVDEKIRNNMVAAFPTPKLEEQ